MRAHELAAPEHQAGSVLPHVEEEIDRDAAVMGMG